MSMKPGTVGHFGIAVRNPKKSAHWWIRNLNVMKALREALAELKRKV